MHILSFLKMAPRKQLGLLVHAFALVFCTNVLLVTCTTQNETVTEEEPCPVMNPLCTCSGEPYYSITCRGLNESSTINSIANNLTERTLILQLDSSNVASFPDEVLRNSFLMSLIIRNCSFSTLLSNPDPCSPEDSSNIHHVVLENVTTATWSWHHFAVLRKLDVLFLFKTTIGSGINSSFGDYVSKSLKMLSISGSNISSIENGAFREFKDLTYLRVSFSKLRTLERNIFPENSKLQQLKLDHNQIQSLPSDMFQNFDNLTVVSLSNNSISTLPEQIYHPLARSDVQLDLRSNPIKCDCRLNWLLTSPLRLNITGNCSFPKKLFGKNLKDLKKKDLRC